MLKERINTENTKDLDSIYQFLLARDVNKKIFFPKTMNEIEVFLKKL